jgi:hypothetical protein
VHRLDVPNSLNTILIATNQPTTVANLTQNYQTLEGHPLLHEVLEDAIATYRPTVTSDVIFTDDHAPVEGIVDEMTLEFLLNGEVNTLR